MTNSKESPSKQEFISESTNQKEVQASQKPKRGQSRAKPQAKDKIALNTKLHSKIVPVSLRRSKSNRTDSNYHDRTQIGINTIFRKGHGILTIPR